MEITLHLAKQVDLLQGTNSRINASKEVHELIPHKNPEKPIMMLGLKIRSMLEDYQKKMADSKVTISSEMLNIQK